MLWQRARRRSAGIAIGKLSGRLIHAQEEERRRIARELHDDFSQRLAVQSIELDQLREKLPESEVEGRSRAGKLLKGLRVMSSDVRALSHRLHSSRLQLVGLGPALSGLCEEVTRKHKVDVSFREHDISMTLSKDVALCLFRIAQEALNNVVRHSQAKSALVELTANSMAISLLISDQGKGFERGLNRTGRGNRAHRHAREAADCGRQALGKFGGHPRDGRACPNTLVWRYRRSAGRNRTGGGKPVMSRPRVLIADDHQMLADALTTMLEPRCDVVGRVKDGRELVDAAGGLQPDVIVLDIAMPRLNGLDAARQLKAKMPGVKLIFMTMHEDPYLVGEAFRAGASAFLLKEAAASELTDALDAVLRGRTYVTPSAAEGAAAIALRDPRSRDHAPEATPREREVIQLLAEGRSMKEIADALHITVRTVAGHKYSVMERLLLKTNADVVRYDIKHRIISI